jgi:hypothetical protein
MPSNASKLDHLLIASPDLQAGCDYAKDLLGIQPVTGGSHVGMGTRNALLGLSDGAYIEVIAPDPAQRADIPLGAYLQTLNAPQLTWWAARCNDINKCKKRLLDNGIDAGEIHSWSRQLPDGRILSWQMLLPADASLASALPFFIQWDDMADHPSIELPIVGEVATLRIQHPDHDRLRNVLGADVNLLSNADASIVVELETPKGIVTIASEGDLAPAFGSIR